MMNINLTAASKQQQKKKNNGGLSYGLNSRSTKKQKSLFGDSSSDENENDDDDGASSHNDRRGVVNKQLRKEQQALRKRAQAAVYDFDGTYEEKDDKWKQSAASTNAASADANRHRESRYMSELLQNAKRRRIERDAIYERKLAKEQKQEEELNPEFMGKERFMTSAYKQKLAEREALAREQEAQDKTDVYSNQQGNHKGMAMANFYSNLGRHGRESSSQPDDRSDEKSSSTRYGNSDDHQQERHLDGSRRNDEEKPKFLEGFEPAAPKPGFLDGFEAADQATSSGPRLQNDESEDNKKPSKDLKPPTKTMRQIREEKVAQARIRYLQRQGMTEGEALAREHHIT